MSKLPIAIARPHALPVLRLYAYGYRARTVPGGNAHGN